MKKSILALIFSIPLLLAGFILMPLAAVGASGSPYPTFSIDQNGNVTVNQGGPANFTEGVLKVNGQNVVPGNNTSNVTTTGSNFLFFQTPANTNMVITENGTIVDTVMLAANIGVNIEAYSPLLLQISNGTWIGNSSITKVGTLSTGSIPSTLITGLGTMATQNSNSVALTGGNIANLVSANVSIIPFGSNIVIDGDSIGESYPYNATANAWPNVMMNTTLMFGRGTLHNVAYPGVNVWGSVANYTANVHPYAPATTGVPAYLIMNCNTNDAAQSNTTAAILAEDVVYVGLAHADGFKVYWNTITGRGYNSGNNTDGSSNPFNALVTYANQKLNLANDQRRQTLNYLIAAGYTGADGVIDMASALHDSGDSFLITGNANSLYYDSLHLYKQGYAIMGQLAAQRLNSLHDFDTALQSVSVSQNGTEGVFSNNIVVGLGNSIFFGPTYFDSTISTNSTLYFITGPDAGPHVVTTLLPTAASNSSIYLPSTGGNLALVTTALAGTNSITSATGSNLTLGTLDGNHSVVVTPNGSGNLVISSGAQVQILNATASFGVGQGGLIVSGGAGVGGNLWLGGTLVAVTGIDVGNTSTGISMTQYVFTNQHQNFGTTSTDGIFLQNNQTATSGAPVQYSPRIRLEGTAYNGSGSQLADVWEEVQPVNVASGNITSKFVLTARVNAGANTTILTLYSNGRGTFTLSGGTATVANTSVTANSTIDATNVSLSGTAGALSYVITPGTGFVVTGLATDNSIYNYLILN